VNGVVEEQGKYHIVIHYKPTSFVKSKGQIQLIPNGAGKLTIDANLPYCAALDGCRSKAHFDKPIAFRKGVASIMLDFPREVQIVSDIKFTLF